jgi:hypothetical protein
MPPVRRRLSAVQHCGPYPTIKIARKHFSELEEIYGLRLSTADRATIQGLCDEYLSWRVRELVSRPRSELGGEFERVRQTIEPFIHFTRGALLGSEGATQVDSILLENYDRFELQLQPDCFRTEFEEGQSGSPEGQQPIFLPINATFLMQLGEALSRVLISVRNTIDEDNKSGEAGLSPGSALWDLLWQLREWAKGAGYPISPFKNDTKKANHRAPAKLASPFSCFVFELVRILGKARVPARFRTAGGARIESLAENILSVQAMAERLKAVAANANSLAGDEGE